MMRRPHLKVEKRNGHVILIMEDTEVFDFVEDILLEQHSLQYAYLESEETNGVTTYILHFPETNDPTILQTVVDAIDPGELQRIWDLNN